MSRPKRPAPCHPDRSHYGLELCSLCYRRRYKKLHSTAINDGQRNWRMSRGEEQRAYMREYSRNHTQQEQSKRIKWRYGLTPESYAAFLVQQSGGCAICTRVPVKFRLAIDHDHKTGKVRGLLCRQCNAALGLLQDRPEIALAAADYLTRTK